MTRWRILCSLLCCTLLAGLLLTGCVHSDLRPLAVATLVNRADELLADSITGARYIQFDVRYDGEAVLAEDRFPDWGRETFEACYYWTDEFDSRNSFGIGASGRVWGWTLINRGLEIHILEIAYEDSETGETHTLLSQWEEPSAEE
ncbi:hypothetical protein ACFLSF_00470 [Candidatus Bipolaricaulota bacterium]